ncbi:class I SAM-dependent methyltransferase [Nonomuraea salmonea]|uniref:Class I SAM-dependent methyltransferase n=2 Tax=Nonomuraea salmonea TaxID=46181 RepID=A0ABV5P084_9ACTN
MTHHHAHDSGHQAAHGSDEHDHRHGAEHASGHGQGQGHGHHDPRASAAMAELLDLDAEVLQPHLAEVTAWIGELTADRPPFRLLDLGSGTGAGTFALLERFADAEVTAVDMSEDMLRHLEAKARERGVDKRVRTLQADLDSTWPEVGTVDLVWAAASLHHLADPDRVLGEVLAALRPGGLLVAVEMDSFPRFLPEDLGFGRPGLEGRGHAVLDERRAAALPTFGSDWGPRLAANGFTVEAEREFVIDLRHPLPPAATRYAEVALRRMRGSLDGTLAADDLAALDDLLAQDGPRSLSRRDDLSVRTRRTIWLARRPHTGF